MKTAILLAIISLPAALIAQTPKRLVSQARYIASATGFQLSDSAHYTYSGERGSRFDVQHLGYTDISQLGRAPNADAIWQRYPMHNLDSLEWPQVDYDSAYFAIGIDQAPPNSLIRHEGHRYDASGALSAVFSEVRDPASGNNQLYGQRSVSVYSGGQLSRSYIWGFDGVGYDTSFIRDYRYSPTGQLLLDSLSFRLSTGNYTGFHKISFAYGTGAGYLSSTRYKFVAGAAALMPDEHDSVRYYPDGRLMTRKTFRMAPSGRFLPEFMDSVGYTPGVAGYTYLREDLLDTLGAPEFTYYSIADRINAAGRKDSMTVSGFLGTAPVSSQRIAIVYDSAGYPATRTDYFSSSGPGPYSIEYYRYENRPQPGVGIGSLHPLSFSLYPNPSRGTLHYTVEGLSSGAAINVEVYTVSGRPVHRENTQWNGAAQQLILGPEAPAGNYILRIGAADGRRSSRQFTRL